MFYKKKSWFKGFIKVKVVGEYPELFFDLCSRNGIQVWNIKKAGKTVCFGEIELADVKKIKILKRKTIHKLYFESRLGFPFFLKHTFYQRPLIIGFVVAVCFIFILSNMVWRIDVVGLDEELEKKVNDQLDNYGVKKGNFQWNIEVPGEIQKKLLKDIPELLWIGVKKNGTTYYLEGVEKTRVEKQQEDEIGHLVAAKDGVIVDLYVKKGQPSVKVNDVVQKGDLLISAYLGQNKQTDKKDDEKEDKQTAVVAQGEVIAKVWYKTTVDMPFDDNYDVLTGKNVTKHYIDISQLKIPIWNFSSIPFQQKEVEVEEKSFYFLNWKLPISYHKEVIHEEKNVKVKRTKEEARKLALEQSKRNLFQLIPTDAIVEEEKVLHERVENGKVKLTIYYTVLEDITKRQPLYQGD
ncbi:sporulation protein YqfD [Gracilibacillus marinus]|jgi:similar to stage IV sporulation protein|uniref:Sporulation protein YqfD n=1 Tax=Gracilibacillus marinus TaxID=630535 RepID=A0ABV8VVE4_9BACI